MYQVILYKKNLIIVEILIFQNPIKFADTNPGVFSNLYQILLYALEAASPFRSSCSLVRLGLAPPRVETLCCSVVSAMVSIVDNLRRGLSSEEISDLCSLCGEGKEQLIIFSCIVKFLVMEHFCSEMWIWMVLFRLFGWYV